MGRHASNPILLTFALTLAAPVASAAGSEWSPNGRWLAHVQAPAASPSDRGPRWLLGRDDAPRPADRRRAGSYRLWATRPEGMHSVLLAESAGPIAAASWNPDGTALAYAAFDPDAGRYEIRIRESAGRSRAIYAKPVGGRALADALPGLAVAWSPDGRHIAAPAESGRGLLVLRAEDGRVLKGIDDARAPAWSPDGSRLAYVAAGRAGEIWCLDAHFGPPRRLIGEAGFAGRPWWTADSRALRIPRRRPADAPKAAPDPFDDPDDTDPLELVRVATEGGRVDVLVRQLFVQSTETPSDPPSDVLLAADDEFQNLFYAVPIRHAAQEIVWMQPGRGVLSRFPPIDIGFGVQSLDCSPSAVTLAIRIGEGPSPGPLCLFDIASRTFRPVAPDADSRAAWIDLLVAATLPRLRGTPIADGPDGQPDPLSTRPTLLPLPDFGDNPDNGSSSDLKRLARLGLPLCRAESSDHPRADLDEIRLLFAYLQDDFAAAQDALRDVTRRAESPDDRLRLLGLRAQIELARGNRAGGSSLLEYLRGAIPAGRKRIEDRGDGTIRLVPDPSPAAGWLGRLESLNRHAAIPGASSIPPVINNPDNPDFGEDPDEFPFGFDPRAGIDDLPDGPVRPEPLRPGGP